MVSTRGGGVIVLNQTIYNLRCEFCKHTKFINYAKLRQLRILVLLFWIATEIHVLIFLPLNFQKKKYRDRLMYNNSTNKL